jgi:hypothetical protein
MTRAAICSVRASRPKNQSASAGWNPANPRYGATPLFGPGARLTLRHARSQRSMSSGSVTPHCWSTLVRRGFEAVDGTLRPANQSPNVVWPCKVSMRAVRSRRLNPACSRSRLSSAANSGRVRTRSGEASRGSVIRSLIAAPSSPSPTASSHEVTGVVRRTLYVARTNLYGHLRATSRSRSAREPWNRQHRWIRVRDRILKGGGMTTSRPSRRLPAPAPIRARRCPGAYLAPAKVRTSQRAIRLTVGPLPIRVLRAVITFVYRLFKIPDLPPAKCVAGPGTRGVRRSQEQPAPRCLHCKTSMRETHRELPEPYGVWVVFGCRNAACPICRGPCGNQARSFLPPHWQTGGPGQITRL